MKKNLLLGAIILLVLLANFDYARADNEKIENYNIQIQINSDSSVNITEFIQYSFGSDKKHGIYRDIPVKYKTKRGNYNLRVSNIFVTDEFGNKYNYEKSSVGNDLRLKIGDADAYVAGTKTYVINYKVKRAINYFADYDELYWNAVGNKWNVPINKSSVSVILPRAISENNVQKACFIGLLGSTKHCDTIKYSYKGEAKIKKIEFYNGVLNSGEGFTVVVGFPKGNIIEPSKSEMLLEFLRDNWILFFPIIVLILMLYLWHTRGRDPEGRGTIIAEFEPPDNLSPAEIGVIIDEKVDNVDISSEIIHLAIKGYLKITRIEKKGIIFKSKDYKLEKLKQGDDLKNRVDNKLLYSIFKNGASETKLSDLKDKFYKDLIIIKKYLYEDMVNKKYFPKSPKRTRTTYLVISIIMIISGVFLAPTIKFAGFFGLFASGLIVFVFSFIMPAKTKKGAIAKERILGLKTYLSVAEKERIKFHNAPEKNPKHFEKLLPYAMALGVEKQWAKQFEGIYNEQPSWYRDPVGMPLSAAVLTSNLNDFSASAGSSLSSAPSSASSGGSGFSGGFSGGGFGGGGGGSW